MPARKVKRVFVVHGELATQQAYQIKLIQAGFKHVEIPVKGETFTM
jgi:hypothetical protein